MNGNFNSRYQAILNNPWAKDNKLNKTCECWLDEMERNNPYGQTLMIAHSFNNPTGKIRKKYPKRNK